MTGREEQGGRNLNEDLVLLFQEIERQGNARENTHGEDPSYEDCNVMQKRFTYLLYFRLVQNRKGKSRRNHHLQNHDDWDCLIGMLH